MLWSQSARSVPITTDCPSGAIFTSAIETKLKNSSILSFGLSAACARTGSKRREHHDFQVRIGKKEKNHWYTPSVAWLQIETNVTTGETKQRLSRRQHIRIFRNRRPSSARGHPERSASLPGARGTCAHFTRFIVGLRPSNSAVPSAATQSAHSRSATRNHGKL